MTQPDNDYPTGDDEQAAHTATYANLARAAIFRHYADTDFPNGCPWAGKVEDVLDDAMNKLEALAWEECRHRPGMLEIGRARHAEWAKQFEGLGELDDEIDPTIERTEAGR